MVIQSFRTIATLLVLAPMFVNRMIDKLFAFQNYSKIIDNDGNTPSA